MVNMNVRFTRLVKGKLDMPYWELIENRRQRTHLFGRDVFLKMCLYNDRLNANTFVP
jgi:hypothetical protein